jgi:phage tail sheath protein FI
LKVCFGDWIYWNDPVNQVTRLVNPTGFFAGRLQNLSPEQSSLNKPIYGIVGTQRSTIGAANGTYSEYEIQQLELAGIDVITNPSPGGTYWSARVGHNSSSSATINGDNYTRMTNYIASTLAAGMGVYIGQTITPSLYNSVNATLNAFNKNLFGQNMIAAWSVQCNPANNPESQTSLGYLTAAVNVQYLAINEKFIIDLTAGISVTIASQQNTPTFDAQNNNSVG